MECELLRSPMISYRSLLYNTTVLYDIYIYMYVCMYVYMYVCITKAQPPVCSIKYTAGSILNELMS